MEVIDFIYVVMDREKVYNKELPDGNNLIDDTQTNLHAFLNKEDAIKWAKHIAEFNVKNRHMATEGCEDSSKLDLDHWAKLGTYEIKEFGTYLYIEYSVTVDKVLFSTVDLIGGA